MKMTSVPQEWYHEWKNFYMTILGLICLHSQNRHLSQEENRASVAYCSCIEVHLCNTMEREDLGHTIFELIPILVLIGIHHTKSIIMGLLEVNSHLLLRTTFPKAYWLKILNSLHLLPTWSPWLVNHLLILQ